MHSLTDLLRGSTGRRYHDLAVRKLRGAAWLSNALLVTKMKLSTFASSYIHHERSDSRLEQKWKSGKVSPSPQSVSLVERKVPNTRWVFDLEMWSLLRNVLIDQKQPLHFIRTHSSNGYWRFPADDHIHPPRRNIAVPIDDTQGLTYRGDLYGFTALLALVRIYEVQNETMKHSVAIKDLFRAVPWALKEPWLRPHAKEFLAVLRTLKHRNPYTRSMFEVDEEVILRQADDPTLELHPAWWKLDQSTNRHVAPEDPILEARITWQRPKKKAKQDAA